MVPTLYTTPISANGRKALAVARQLSIDLEVTPVNVYRGEGRAEWYLRINPQGKVPTLVDGDLVLWESNAILVYLSEVHGDFGLFSRDGRKRAEVLRWMFWEAAHWQPALCRVLEPRAAQVLFPSPDGKRAQVRWDDAELVRLMGVLGSALDSQPFLCGDELSLADFAVAGMTTYFRAADFPEAQHPTIAAWLRRMAEIPAWDATLAEPWR